MMLPDDVRKKKQSNNGAPKLDLLMLQGGQVAERKRERERERPPFCAPRSSRG